MEDKKLIELEALKVEAIATAHSGTRQEPGLWNIARKIRALARRQDLSPVDDTSLERSELLDESEKPIENKTTQELVEALSRLSGWAELKDLDVIIGIGDIVDHGRAVDKLLEQAKDFLRRIQSDLRDNRVNGYSARQCDIAIASIEEWLQDIESK